MLLKYDRAFTGLGRELEDKACHDEDCSKFMRPGKQHTSTRTTESGSNNHRSVHARPVDDNEHHKSCVHL